MPVVNLQGIVDSDGVYHTGARALKLPPELAVTEIADTDSPGYVGPNGSVRAVFALSFTAESLASSYIKATSGGGGDGLTIGRWDLDADSGAITDALRVKNDDGSDYSFVVDNGSSLTSSAWDFQVGGSTGTTLGRYSLKVEDSGMSTPATASGYAQLYYKDSALRTDRAFACGGGLSVGNGNTGFFGATPIPKQTISGDTTSTLGDLGAVVKRICDVLGDGGGYGLFVNSVS